MDDFFFLVHQNIRFKSHETLYSISSALYIQVEDMLTIRLCLARETQPSLSFQNQNKRNKKIQILKVIKICKEAHGFATTIFGCVLGIQAKFKVRITKERSNFCIEYHSHACLPLSKESFLFECNRNNIIDFPVSDLPFQIYLLKTISRSFGLIGSTISEELGNRLTIIQTEIRLFHLWNGKYVALQSGHLAHSNVLIFWQGCGAVEQEPFSCVQ